MSQGRRDAIAHYGAEVREVKGNYDDAVRHAAATAAANGWTVVSDTSYPGYRDIPLDVMHGYGVMAAEIARQMRRRAADARVRAGGRGRAGGGDLRQLLAALGARAGRRSSWSSRTRADCVYQSLAAGRPVVVGGALDTVMAGLACGEVSELAWEILHHGANAAVAVDDAYALAAMRALAFPRHGDPAIVAGETGGTGLAALLAAARRSGDPRDAGARRQRRACCCSAAKATPIPRSTARSSAARPRRCSMKAEQLRINPTRLMDRLNRLAEIGATADGSCCRLALTDEDQAGRDLVVGWMRELGLEVRVDPIGNIFGLRDGTESVDVRAGDDAARTSTPCAPAAATTATSACSAGWRSCRR